MKITGARLSRITLHTHEPFRIAFETLDECHGVLLELLTDQGMTGLGEASPARRITGETFDTVVSVLETVLIPAVKGCDPFDVAGIHARMNDSIRGNPAAKAAIDLACHDLMGKAAGKPVASVIGGAPRTLPTDHTISIKPPAEQAAIAETLIKKGYRALKVKVGAGAAEDVARVKAIRERVGDGPAIRVDANQGWSVRDALFVLERIAPYGIELAEQPVAAADLKGLAFIRARSPIPVAADESVLSPVDALRAVEAGACDIINIKLMKCGGIYPAQQIAAIVETAHLSCMIGGMIGESRLAVGAAAHFAAARTVVKYCDLDADLLLRDELVEEGGIGLKDGSRLVPDSPGLGVETFHGKFLSSLSPAVPT